MTATAYGHNAPGYRGYEPRFSVQGALPDTYSGHLVSGIADEQRYRDKHKWGGVFDLYLAVKGAVATAMMGQLQDEAHAMSPYQQSAHDWITSAVNAPFDWRAMGLAVSTFALLNAAERVNSAVRFPHESRDWRPETPFQTFGRRALGRLGRGVLTAVGCFAAYEAAKQGTPAQDEIASAAIFGLTLVSLGTTKAIATVRARRERRTNSARDAFLARTYEW